SHSRQRRRILFGNCRVGLVAPPRLRETLRIRLPSTRHRTLATENHSQHETDAERGKDRFRRVLSDVLLTVVLKTADATDRIIPCGFRATAIFLGHCACG